MSLRRGTLGLYALCALTVACEPPKEDDREIAEAVARGITASCPMSSPGDQQARAECAAKLTGFDLLRDTMQEPFMWGSQKAGKGYRLSDSETTRFNALVWRRMYLSLFMFTGESRIEQSGDFIVIHLPYRFRNDMDIGAYPYPFWHTKAKWDSWQLSPELILVMEKGKLTGALRSIERDPARTYVNHTWSGQWRWKAAGQEMPYVSLYRFLFSTKNPHVEKLDHAYRELESELRENACFSCHAPDNGAKVSQLEFFNFPNQALYSRHNIVLHVERNSMPPAKNDIGLAEGIQDPTTRDRLLTLARAFEAAGDEALGYEGELKPAMTPLQRTP